MSCEECSKEQEIHTDSSGFYYRWKNANLLIVGCREHVSEFINYINSMREK